MCGKGGIRAGKKKEGLTICMYNVGVVHREGCATQRRQVVILQHLTSLMDSDCNGICAGDLVRWESSKHYVLHVFVD